MADTYLPADVRKRIVDVMRERKMIQRELALRIDVNESTISRFLSGKTEKLSEESVIRMGKGRCDQHAVILQHPANL